MTFQSQTIHESRATSCTVKDSTGKPVTSVRIGKGKTILADIPGVFTLDQGLRRKP
jgi:hypothetical protein